MNGEESHGSGSGYPYCRLAATALAADGPGPSVLDHGSAFQTLRHLVRLDVAKELNAKWKGDPARVFYLSEYYTEDIWSYDYLKQIGIVQQPDVRSATRWDIHDDYHYEALVALQDPKLIHAEQRIKANKFSIYGVEIGSVQKMQENGRKLAEYRATITLNALKKAQAEFAVP